jgi:osmotically-inducible protein OsmY
MTHHDHQHRQRGGMTWDEDDERGHRGYPGDQRQFGGRGSWVQDRGEYGGWASGEGQGEFADDGYSAQGQFSNQRVAQYGDQGYGQDYGREGIGWQNRPDDDNRAFGQGTGWEQGPSRERGFRGERQFSDERQGPYGRDFGHSGQHSHEGYGQGQSDWQRDAGGGYWGQGAGGGQGLGGSDSWRQEQSRNWAGQMGSQGYGHGPTWQGRGGETGYSAAGSWMAGPHSGRGPQGYQRSDTRIEEDVCEHLTHHGMLDATGIQVQVENGEVTLAGTVESRQAKRLAEDILDSISGVRDVHNQLRVQRRDQGQGHQNPFMAQAQMGEGDGQGSNGQGQSRGQSQRAETKAGTSNS